MEEIKTWERRIRCCLEAAGRYTSALDINIYLLAVALWRHSLAVGEGAELASTILRTPNGALQLHPAFKMQIESEKVIKDQLKELGLTARGTSHRTEADPLAELVGHLAESIPTKTLKVK